MAAEIVVSLNRCRPSQVELRTVRPADVEAGERVLRGVINIHSPLGNKPWRVAVGVNRELQIAECWPGSIEVRLRISVIFRARARRRKLIDREPRSNHVFATRLQTANYLHRSANRGVKRHAASRVTQSG